MVRLGFYTVLLIAALAVIPAAVICSPARAAEDPVKTLAVEEVKTEQDGGADRLTFREVEEARLVTAERVYILLILWAVILLAIVLIRLQTRDDERLYQEGYYSKDLE